MRCTCYDKTPQYTHSSLVYAAHPATLGPRAEGLIAHPLSSAKGVADYQLLWMQLRLLVEVVES